MKRGTVLLAICIGVALLVMLGIQHSTQAQRPGQPGGRTGRRPPRGQFMMPGLSLEASWAHVSFELGVADEVLPRVRKIYKETWNGRKKLLRKMTEARGDREAMGSIRSDAEKLRSNLDKKLKDVLTPEQLEKFAKWEKEFQEQMRRPPRAPQGSPRGRQR